MTCEAPIRECLQWHYAEHFANAKLTKNGPPQIHARSPLCDARQGLVISAGQWKRTVWQCFACKGDGAKLRRAIIDAGVPQSCVPSGDGTETTQGEVLDAIHTDLTASTARRVLRAHVVRRGYTHWPGGDELVQLAEEVGLKRAAAYKLAGMGPLVDAHLTLSYRPPRA